jgi:ABC-type amino acid transport substrate-binding protein
MHARRTRVEPPGRHSLQVESAAHSARPAAGPLSASAASATWLTQKPAPSSAWRARGQGRAHHAMIRIDSCKMFQTCYGINGSGEYRVGVRLFPAPFRFPARGKFDGFDLQAWVKT